MSKTNPAAKQTMPLIRNEWTRKSVAKIPANGNAIRADMPSVETLLHLLAGVRANKIARRSREWTGASFTVNFGE